MAFGAMLISFGRIKRSHALAAEIGGMRLLNALSLVAAAMWVLPFFILYTTYDGVHSHYLHGHHHHHSSPSLTWPILWNLILCTLCTMLVNLHTEPFLLSKGTQVSNLKEYRLAVAYVFAVIISFLRADHQVDFWGLLAFVLFLLGLHLRTTPLLSYFTSTTATTTTNELPQYIESTTPYLLLGKWARSEVLHEARLVLEHAMHRRDSRRMLIFLMISFVFMLVEATVGLINNSLGLMSDAGHMLFGRSIKYE